MKTSICILAAMLTSASIAQACSPYCGKEESRSYTFESVTGPLQVKGTTIQIDAHETASERSIYSQGIHFDYDPFIRRFPSELKRVGINGEAIVMVIIGTDRKVSEVRVLYSSDPSFGDEAKRCAYQWDYYFQDYDSSATDLPNRVFDVVRVRFEVE